MVFPKLLYLTSGSEEAPLSEPLRQVEEFFLEVPMSHASVAADEFFSAVRFGTEHTDYLKVLALAGLEVNSRNGEGQTALMVACGFANPQAVAAILTWDGVDVNAQDQTGVTAFHRTVHSSSGDPGEECFFRMLADPRIAVNVSTNSGQTPLMWAARVGATARLQALLARPDVLVNLRDNDGRTAFMHACSTYYPKFHAEPFFIRKDLEINLEAHGETALSFAKKQYHSKEFVAKLERLGAI